LFDKTIAKTIAEKEDLRLFIDGKLIQKVTVTPLKVLKAQQDTAFYKGS